MPVFICAKIYDSTNRFTWFATVDGKYLKESDIGKLDTFKRYKLQGIGNKQCDVNFIARAKISLSLLPITTGVLFNEPYSDSIIMRKVDKSVNLKAVAVVKNKHNEFWLQVSLDEKDYYVPAVCVTEDNSSATPIQFKNPQVPSGNYKLSDKNIPLGGTISSRYSISSAYAFWRSADGTSIIEASVPNINKTSFGIKDKGGINDQLSYSKLKSRKGKGTYYYEIQVHYYKFKDVADVKALPLQESTWTSDPYYFTVEGGSGEPIHGDAVSNVPVTDITLSSSSATIEVGANLFLSPTIKPENATNKKINWSTSNESVATVKDGKVTGVASGTAIITAKADDDSEKAVTCTIAVIKKTTGVTVSPSIVTLYVNATASAKLTESVQPADASNKTVTWSSSNSSIVMVDQSGNITAKDVGTATITAKATDGSEKIGTCQVTVLAYVDTITLPGSSFVSIEELKSLR